MTSRLADRVHRTLYALVFATAFGVSSPVAAAQSTNLQQAKTYFNAGVKAYEAGLFPAAIQAFQQAYKLAPKPAILFTIGQAYRRQYYLDKSLQNLHQAIVHYRQYIHQAPQGRRRADAAQALSELEPLAQRLLSAQQATGDAGAPIASTMTPQPITPKTRLMITSPTPGAVVSLDHSKGLEAPFISEVKKGTHTVEVTAPGFFKQTREVKLSEGDVLALDIALKPKPAKVLFDTEAGAEVSVDGRYVGETPLPQGIEIPSGEHRITILRNGRKAYATKLTLRRGETRRLKVELEASTQRVTSLVLLSTSGVALSAGVGLTLLALSAQNTAQKIADRSANENIGAFDLSDYNDALDRRNQMRTGAFLGYTTTVLFGGFGAWLYTNDMPSTPKSFSLEQASSPTKTKRRHAEPSEMSVSWAPVVTPTSVGVVGTF